MLALTGPGEHACLRVLIEESGDDPLAPFVVHPKKSHVFSPDGKAVIGYAVRLGVAVAGGDPVGRPESWPAAVEAFVGLARRHRWRIAVLGAGERGRPLWAAYGLRALPIGRDVVVRTDGWELAGRRFRNLRQAVRRTHNSGVTTEVLREADVRAVDELRALQRRAHRDGGRGFSMILGGWFDGDHPDAVIAMARDRTGRLVAAQRYLPAGPRWLSLDLPLRAGDAPNGVDERLVADTVAWGNAHGVEQVSLAFAPFPDLFEAPRAGLAGLAALALHAFDPLIHLRRLHRYLRKFHAFDGRRFVMLRLREAPLAAVVLVWLEFGGRRIAQMHEGPGREPTGTFRRGE